MTENEVKLKQKQEDFEKIDKLIRQTLIFSRTKLKLLEALKKALLGAAQVPIQKPQKNDKKRREDKIA